MRLTSIAAAIILAVSLAACDDTVDPCGVNPTTTGIFGQCVEADGELCDADPCDADDFDGVDWHKGHKPTSKPTLKPTPRITRPPVRVTAGTRA